MTGFRILGYRLKQFWRGVTARPLKDEQITAVRDTLTAEQWRLFQRFSPRDQQHSFQVWATLQKAGYQDPILLQAALLHDIGKIREPLGSIGRSWIVIGRLLLPNAAVRWGEAPLAQAGWWIKPFIVRQLHPQWGAEMLRAIGGDDLLCQIVARHQDPVPADLAEERRLLLETLQWADDLN